MEASMITVDAISFQAAMKAALVVAPSSEPHDLVQFRIVRDTLVICARTQWEVIGVTVGTEYVDMNYDRDGVFEITRNEAVALSSMRIKKMEDEDYPRLGLRVHEHYIVRTDESGLGLGLRSVKVKRHGNHYQPELGNIPRVLADARKETPSMRAPQMEPKQVKMVGAAFAAWSEMPVIWTPSTKKATVVRNIIQGPGITMIMMSSPFKDKEKRLEDQKGVDANPLSFEDVPLDIEVDDEKTKHAKELKRQYEAAFEKKTVKANPPGGLA